jgi:hypothetical protein
MFTDPKSMLGEFLVTTTWRALRLRMEGRPPDTEGSFEYIEYAVAVSRQGVVLQLGVGRGANNPSP